jgi:hypothetical protein
MRRDCPGIRDADDGWTSTNDSERTMTCGITIAPHLQAADAGLEMLRAGGRGTPRHLHGATDPRGAGKVASG